MAKNRIFDVLADNLKLISKREQELDRLLVGQFREVVEAYAAEGSPYFGKVSSPAEEIKELYRLVYREGLLCTEEFARFCLEFGRLFGDNTTGVNPPFEMLQHSDLSRAKDEFALKAKEGKVLYIRNPYCDQAFRCFARGNKGMRAVYSQGYASACEDVYNGRGNYVILPIYNSKDGCLITFRRMLRKYDLKIASACFMETEDGDIILYGLAQREQPADDGECLELSVILPEDVTASRFLTVCEVFGLQLRHIHTVPLEYAPDSLSRHEIYLCFERKEANLSMLTLFLDASHIRYEIEGIYNIINQ